MLLLEQHTINLIKMQVKAIHESLRVHISDTKNWLYKYPVTLKDDKTIKYVDHIQYISVNLTGLIHDDVSAYLDRNHFDVYESSEINGKYYIRARYLQEYTAKCLQVSSIKFTKFPVVSKLQFTHQQFNDIIDTTDIFTLYNETVIKHELKHFLSHIKDQICNATYITICLQAPMHIDIYNAILSMHYNVYNCANTYCYILKSQYVSSQQNEICDQENTYTKINLSDKIKIASTISDIKFQQLIDEVIQLISEQKPTVTPVVVPITTPVVVPIATPVTELIATPVTEPIIDPITLSVAFDETAIAIRETNSLVGDLVDLSNDRVREALIIDDINDSMTC